MKRLTYLFVTAVFMACAFSSCDFGVLTTFDDTLLFAGDGKWQTPSETNSEYNLYYVYYSDGTGKTWDEGEDVFESDLVEGGNGWFTWTVDEAEMIHIYKMDNGGAEVPQSYTLTKLTATTLEYTGDNSKKYSFTKSVQAEE